MLQSEEEPLISPERTRPPFMSCSPNWCNVGQNHLVSVQPGEPRLSGPFMSLNLGGFPAVPPGGAAPPSPPTLPDPPPRPPDSPDPPDLDWGTVLSTNRKMAFSEGSWMRFLMIHMNWATVMSEGTRYFLLSMSTI
ncbi:hypothetical protein EYF80_030943 [Liparis tanakae]|uniref:Uncharacterized protein n=1 Tax=Liparis tanakae TaxID=230148 RepID=A0A4Z2H1U8_9TELE|nr:hypothetical protein EYF80_030943 [Liparis tanakae]